MLIYIYIDIQLFQYAMLQFRVHKSYKLIHTHKHAQKKTNNNGYIKKSITYLLLCINNIGIHK